jgi:hypothetical protein
MHLYICMYVYIYVWMQNFEFLVCPKYLPRRECHARRNLSSSCAPWDVPTPLGAGFGIPNRSTDPLVTGGLRSPHSGICQCSVEAKGCRT